MNDNKPYVRFVDVVLHRVFMKIFITAKAYYRIVSLACYSCICFGQISLAGTTVRLFH